MSDALIPVATAITAALAALLGQWLANRSAERRHERELEHRREELWVRFLTPVAERRLTALETVHDTIQTIIEDQQLTPTTYHTLRSASIYLIPELRAQLIDQLQELLQGTKKPTPSNLDKIIKDLRTTQDEIKAQLGITMIDEKLKDHVFEGKP